MDSKFGAPAAEFPQTFRSARLAMRRPTSADVEDWVRISSDPHTNQFHPRPPAWQPNAVRDIFPGQLAAWERDGMGPWAVTVDPNRIVAISGARLTSVDGKPCINIGYRFAPEAWGRGYATELARAAIQCARSFRPDLPIIAFTTPDNLPSQRTALKAGMVRAPHLDRHVTDPDGGGYDGGDYEWTDIFFWHPDSPTLA